MKIMGFILLGISLSIWLMIIVSVGVASGLKIYFEGKKK